MEGRIRHIEQYVVDMVSVFSQNIIKTMSAEKILLHFKINFGVKMNFENRIKGKITETIVKEILVDEGYRVIDSGIEHLLREVSCLNNQEYLNLTISKNLRKLPDLIVMNKLQTKSYLVEIKYRQSWSSTLISNLRKQVEAFEEIVLICVNGTPITESTDISGSTHLRAITLRYNDGSYQAKIKDPKNPEEQIWTDISESTNIDWWDLLPMQFIFDEMTSLARSPNHPKYGLNTNTLLACRAISSLMDSEIWALG